MKDNQSSIREIHISKDGEKYRFLLEGMGTGTISFREELQVPSSVREKVLNSLNNFLKASGGTRGLSKSKIDESITPEGIGKMIYEYLIPRELREKLRNMESRQVILSTGDVEVPWELLHDGEEFFFSKNSVSRSIEASMEIKEPSWPETDQLKFLLVGNPTGDLEGAESEIKALEKSLAQMGSVETDVLLREEASLVNLLNFLEEEHYAVIHYAGHTTYLQDKPELSKIHLNDEKVTAQYLLNILETPPRLAFMNSCTSSSSTDLEYLERNGKMTGFASSFLSSGVEHYIGPLWPVSDKISADLAERFYENLLEGDPVAGSLKEAKQSVMEDHGDSFFSPAFVLYGDPSTTYRTQVDGGSSKLRESTDPYKLSNGKKISLPEITSLLFECCSSGGKSGKKQLKIGFVFGTGRAPNSTGAVGLCSDFMYVPELQETLQKKSKEYEAELKVKSFLDIDILEKLGKGNKLEEFNDFNFILLASGEVNGVSGKILEYYKEHSVPLVPGFDPPYSPYLKGIDGFYDSKNIGSLVSSRSPWQKNRVSFILGGVHGIGTIGSLAVLREYFAGRGWGNNKLSEEVPSKVFSTPPRDYKKEIKNSSVLKVQEDVRNIKREKEYWKILE